MEIKRMLCKIVYSVWLVILMIPGFAFAQKLPMTVDLYQPTQFPKGDGPISFTWQCSVSTADLLEGHFVVSVHDGQEKFGQFRSHDVALHSGYHEIPMLLPPIKVTNPYYEAKLKLSFVTADQKYDFKDEYTLRVGQVFQRIFSLGICDSDESSLSAKMRAFIDSLKFESISPSSPVRLILDRKMTEGLPPQTIGLLQNQQLSLNAKTTSIRVDPDSFPRFPIDCHQYDIIVITPRGFDRMESRHLKPILQWVKSGGSLCLITGHTPETSQLEFLNQLFEDESEIPFLINSEGKLELMSDRPILFQRTGWGRSVVIEADAFENDLLSASEKNRLPFFLWKLRESQKSYYQKQHQ